MIVVSESGEVMGKSKGVKGLESATASLGR